MFVGSKHDHSFSLLEATPHESGQRVKQHTFVLIELRDVFTRCDLAPKYRTLGRGSIRVTAHRISFPYEDNDYTVSKVRENSAYSAVVSQLELRRTFSKYSVSCIGAWQPV